jgi:ribosomal protein S17E
MFTVTYNFGHKPLWIRNKKKIIMVVKMEHLLLRINNSVSQGYITRSMNRKTSKLVLNNFICELEANL